MILRAEHSSAHWELEGSLFPEESHILDVIHLPQVLCHIACFFLPFTEVITIKVFHFKIIQIIRPFLYSKGFLCHL